MTKEFDKFINNISQNENTHHSHKIQRILKSKLKTIDILKDGTDVAETNEDKANMIANKLKQQFAPNKIINKDINRTIRNSNAFIDIVPLQNIKDSQTIKTQITE